VLIGCHQGAEEDLRADGAIYVEAYCTEFVDRDEACVAEGFPRQGDWTFDECVADLANDLDVDPCFVEETEIFRCFAERLTCEEWTADSISALPGTPCAEANADWLACADEHDWDGSG
jgi:hypothetical protein